MNFLERAFEGGNQFWKYILVVLVAFLGGQIIGSIPLSLVVVFNAMSNGGIDMSAINVLDFEAIGVSKNLALFLLMISPVVSLVLTIVMIKMIHNRSFSETVNGTNKIRIGRCLEGIAVWGIILVLYIAVDYLIDKENYILQFDLGKFIPLLLISLIMIPLQTTSEELLFRGYLTQGVAVWTRSRWMAILIPSLIFGLIHAANPEVKEFGFWLAMPQYIFFGLLFGFVAVMDDGIELSMGMHAVNNVFLSLFVTNKSSALQTDAVFEQIHVYPVKETVVLGVMGILAVIYFAWKHQWDFRILKGLSYS